MAGAYVVIVGAPKVSKVCFAKRFMADFSGGRYFSSFSGNGFYCARAKRRCSTNICAGYMDFVGGCDLLPLATRETKSYCLMSCRSQQ